MRHIRYIDDSKLSKLFSESSSVHIEIRTLNAIDFKFLAILKVNGDRSYDGIAEEPLTAINRALYQLAGYETDSDI